MVPASRRRFAAIWIVIYGVAVRGAALIVLSVLTLYPQLLGIDWQIPLVVGWLSDVYGALGDVSIRYALLSSLLFCAAGALSFARASEPYARAVQTGSA